MPDRHSNPDSPQTPSSVPNRARSKTNADYRKSAAQRSRYSRSAYGSAAKNSRKASVAQTQSTKHPANGVVQNPRSAASTQSAQIPSSQSTSTNYAQQQPRQTHPTINPQNPKQTPQSAYPRSTMRPAGGYVRSRGNRSSSYTARYPSIYQDSNPEIYSDRSRYTGKKTKKPLNKIALALGAAAIVLAAVGAWFVMNPASFEITLNGNSMVLDRGTTIGALIEEGYVTPKPGNLLAIDGNILQTGAGNTFSGTVNGRETTNPDVVLHQGDSVYVEDGTDATETYTTETVATVPEIGTGGVGSLHVYLDGKEGVANRMVGDLSGVVIDEAVQPTVNGGFIKYNADTKGEKVVALTFDDGPWPETTEQILDVLKQYGAKATFFTIGNQIGNMASVVKRAFDEGNQIATHTWDHASGSGGGVDMTKMSAEEQRAEVEKGYQAIADATGVKPDQIIRAPGGNYSGSVIWELQDIVDAEIGWNIDTQDWRQPGVDAIVSQIESATPGSIILMHDGGGDRSQTVEALKIALPYLIQEGYKFVTINELLAYNDPSTLNVDVVTS